MSADDPYCEDRHPATQALYDSFGYPFCPDCEDESWELGERIDKFLREPCPHTGTVRRECACVCPDCGKGRHKSLKVERCYCATSGNSLP